ncbi:MAG: chromosome segregation ATPase [Bradymonadia bacterium]|jgi:chromosome segregation ATPase
MTHSGWAHLAATPEIVMFTRLRPPSDGFAIIRRARQETPADGHPFVTQSPETPVSNLAVPPASPARAENAQTSRQAGQREVALGRLTVAVTEVERALEQSGAFADAAALKSLNERVANLGGNVLLARDESGSLRNIERELVAVRRDLDRMRILAAKQRDTIVTLQDRGRQLEDALVAAHRMNGLERERSGELERQIDHLENDLKAYRIQRSESPQRIDQLTRQVDTLKEALIALRRRELRAMQDSDVARAEVDMLKAELCDTRALLQRTHEAHGETRNALAAAQQEAREARVALEDSEGENEIMERWLDSTLARVAELEARLAPRPLATPAMPPASAITTELIARA